MIVSVFIVCKKRNIKHFSFSLILLYTIAFIHTGVPDWDRTNGLSLRRRALYPTELQEQLYLFYSIFKKNSSLKK